MTSDALRKLLLEFSCGDGGCIFARPSGMATNGGCQTLKDNTATRRALQKLVHEVRKFLAAESEPHNHVLSEAQRKCDAARAVATLIQEAAGAEYEAAFAAVKAARDESVRLMPTEVLVQELQRRGAKFCTDWTITP